MPTGSARRPGSGLRLSRAGSAVDFWGWLFACRHLRGESPWLCQYLPRHPVDQMVKTSRNGLSIWWSVLRRLALAATLV